MNALIEQDYHGLTVIETNALSTEKDSIENIAHAKMFLSDQYRKAVDHLGRKTV
jgi:hypothetical protein